MPKNLSVEDMGKCGGCITEAVLERSWPWIQLRIPSDDASVASSEASEWSKRIRSRWIGSRKHMKKAKQKELLLQGFDRFFGY